MKDPRNLTMIQLIDGTNYNVNALFKYNSENLHESALETLLEDAEHMIINTQIYVEDSGIEKLPKYYAEHIRIYARLTSKLMRKYNLE